MDSEPGEGFAFAAWRILYRARIGLHTGPLSNWIYTLQLWKDIQGRKRASTT